MKTVVIYKPKSGFTKEYAKWIAQELTADLRAIPCVLANFWKSKNSSMLIWVLLCRPRYEYAGIKVAYRECKKQQNSKINI